MPRISVAIATPPRAIPLARQCLVALLAAIAATTARAALPDPIAKAMHDNGVPLNAVSVYVREVGHQEPLIDHRGSVPMSPASTMKIVTTLVGLDVLTPNYTWKTTFHANSRIENGVLLGPLYIKGSGDPKFVTEHLQAAISALRARGIRDIAGDVLLDRSRFASATHDPALFDGQPLRPYNVGPDALLFNFKSVGFKFLPKSDGTVAVSAEGLTPDGLNISNRLRVTGTPGGGCGDWRSLITPSFASNGHFASASFTGTYPRDCAEQSWYVSLFEDGGLLAGSFARLWRDAGGTWGGAIKAGITPKNARVLYTHTSAPLASMVTDINKFSNNVMARQLLLTLDAEISKRPGQARRGGRSIREWAQARGFDLPDLIIENGSGLSRVERVSAQSMAKILEYGLTAPFAREFVSSLPLAATDGTLAKRFVNHLAEGSAYLKTGTLTGVKALAGYLLLPGDRKMIIVAMINHGNAEVGQKALDSAVDWVYQSEAAHLKAISK
jgi:serine-type D-Ala-D-Ala carboxypeptidase/endopeptidase (penicillin-binding protein 4)